MNVNKMNMNFCNLLFRLMLLTRRWRKVLDTEIRSMGLTDATWRPLLHLHLLGDGTRQKDLAESLGIKGPSIVRLLDTLLEKGLIRRLEDDRDRRAKLIYLTSEGRVLVLRIQKTVISLENKLFKTFSDSDISRIEYFILRLESALKNFREEKKQ